MTAENLGQQLREGRRRFLRCRRGVAALSLAACASLGVVSLYQLGIIDHVPDPPLPGFDADKVTGSAAAYRLLGVPDGVLGIASYAVTTVLAAAGGEDRAETVPWLPLLLGLKVGFDAIQAARLTLNEVRVQRALCFCCLLASGCTALSVPLVVPETRSALEHLRRRGDTTFRVG